VKSGFYGKLEGILNTHGVVVFARYDDEWTLTLEHDKVQYTENNERALPAENLSEVDTEKNIKTIFADALTNSETGAAYRDARKARGMTQVEVAEAMSFKQGVISDFERGEFSASPEWKARYLAAIGFRQGIVLEPII
ncbi:MAG: helix-turn-helix transcriptional regulator, partial [Pseudomonadota bacterium]